MIVSLSGVNKEGYVSLDKIKETITEEVKDEKKAEKLLAAITTWDKAVAAKGASCDTIRHITFSAPSFIRATSASEPIISALASKTKKGATAGPVKGNKGIYMLKVLNQTNFGEKFDAKQEQETTSSQNIRMASSAVMQTLYLNANVKDQRYKFF